MSTASSSTFICPHLLPLLWGSKISWNACSETDTSRNWTRLMHNCRTNQAVIHSDYSLRSILVQRSSFCSSRIIWHITSCCRQGDSRRRRSTDPKRFPLFSVPPEKNLIHGWNPCSFGWLSGILIEATKCRVEVSELKSLGVKTDANGQQTDSGRSKPLAVMESPKFQPHLSFHSRCSQYFAGDALVRSGNWSVVWAGRGIRYWYPSVSRCSRYLAFTDTKNHRSYSGKCVVFSNTCLV